MEAKGKNPPCTQTIPASKHKYIPKIPKDLKKYKSPVQKIGSVYGLSQSNAKAPESQIPDFQSCGAQTLHLPDRLLDLAFKTDACIDMDMFNFQVSIYKESSCPRKTKDATKEDPSNKGNSDKTNERGGRKAITFEFTDSDDDESNISGNKGTGISLYYSCKHCEYSNVNIDTVAAHYQNHHPYVIYNQVYIQDPSDLSATFRCLTCPVEFLTLSELKAHNMQSHPHSLNLFAIQSSDLSFRCFVCAFTCRVLEELKRHYNEEHPSYEVDSTLKFCRYWVDTRRDEQPQLNDCVKAPVSEMLQHCSPNTSPSSRNEYNNVNIDSVAAHNQNDHSSVKHNKTNIQDSSDPPATFRCLICPLEFLILSELKAHYVQNHRHSTHAFAIQLSDCSFKCFICAFTCSALADVKTHYEKKHQTHEEDSTLKFCRNPVDTREEEQPHLNDCVTTSVSKKPQQCSPNTSPSSRKDTFQNMPSNQHQSPVSQNMAPTDCVTREKQSFNKTNDKYQSPETLFYCQKCNYANVTAKGVLNHQIRLHQPACMEDIFEYTTKIRDELKHLRSQAEDSSYTCQLPLPLLENGDEDVLFCHLCNYRNDKMNLIMKHYFEKHDKWKVECDQVKKHSSNIHKQIKDLYPQATSGQKVRQASNVEKIASKRSEKLHNDSVDFQQKWAESEERNDPDDTDSSPLSPRSEQEESEPLTCKVCLFRGTSPTVIVEHCRTAHPWSVEKDGSVLPLLTRRDSRTSKELENEKEIPPTFENYQVPLEFESSPTSTVSPINIQCNFCPESFSTQYCVDVHCNKMHHGGVMDNSNAQIGEPSIASCAQPDEIDSPLHVFKCPYCSYVSSMLVGIFVHSSMIHPGLFITKENCHLQTENTLDFKKFAKIKGTSWILRGYLCKKCPQIYDTQKMLAKHLQEVHCETTTGSQPEAQTLTLDKDNHQLKSQSATSNKSSMFQLARSEADDSQSTLDDNAVLLYQCPKCPYVNVTDFGFLMHCQHKHPSLLARAKEFRKEKTIIANFKVLKNEKRLIIAGYKCQKCSHIFCTVNKLNTHWKRDCSPHNTLAPEKTEDNPNLSLLPQKDDPLYKCRLCPYKPLNRKHLFDHYRNKHKLTLPKRRKLFKSDARDESSLGTAANKSDEVSNLEGKTRFNSEIQSTQQLHSHTRTAPLFVSALDFIVLAKPSKKATGLYKCSHCGKHVTGTKRLSSHLDKHRHSARKAAVDRAVDLAAPSQDEPPMLETVQDLASVGTFNDPQSPTSSLSIPPILERMEPLEKEASFTCKLCGRIFKHQKGLASHERSHATVAALRKQCTDSTSSLKHSINKYILYKADDRRPYLCTLCRYSSTIPSLLRRHLLKKHECIVRSTDVTDSQRSDESAASKVASPTQMLNDLPEHPDDRPAAEGLSYSEAPEVRRQLDHYNKMAQDSDTSDACAQKEASPAAATLLQCELCRYSARCPPTLRKHYSTRHGKKMRTCKDCSFVTSSKKSMKKHSEMGHDSSRQLPGAAHQDDLSCPFCLYQTKNKNYMIDHIVLHREERVVPIEPCRPHLSRYLQGVVHRCHKCTYTSGSAESLRLHMTKHDDVKPYKCQLCYFDCTQLSDLEAHLSNKHQVLRNHELVGQIMLDDLEGRLERTTPEGDHTMPDTSAIIDCDSIGVQTKTIAVVEIDTEHLRDEDTPQNPAKLQDSEQEDPQPAQCLSDTSVEKETELTAGEVENIDCQTAETGNQIQENQAQLKPGNDEEDNNTNSGLKELKVVQLFEGAPDKKPGLPPTERVFNDAKIEEHILRCVPQLVKDNGTVTKRRKSHLDLPVKETALAHNRLLFNNMSTKLVGVKSPSQFTFQRHSLTRGVYDAQRKFSSAGVMFTAAKDKQIEKPGRSERVESSCGENKGLAGRGHRISRCKEQDHGDDEATPQRKKPRYEDDGAIKRAESPHVSEGAHTTSFACNLCGRKFVNSCQLERHIVQHGK